jgi:hypothetical protein
MKRVFFVTIDGAVIVTATVDGDSDRDEEHAERRGPPHRTLRDSIGQLWSDGC